MKKRYLVLLLLMTIIHVQAQVKNQPRLHNWIVSPFFNKEGIRHIMVISDGTLRSWHAGETPTRYTDIDNAVEVAAGFSHLLILRKDGTIWTVGENDYHQLGNEEFSKRRENFYSEKLVQVTGIDNAISISAVTKTSYALLKDGTVWAWGNASEGMCGDGRKVTSSMTLDNASTPVQVKGLKNIVAISGAMALRADGTVWTWGSGYHGRLGINSLDATSIPVQVPGITNAVAIANDDDDNYALLEDGTIRSWGYNYKGQLGNGASKPSLSDNSGSLVPVKVVGISNAIDINAHSSCLALLTNGEVRGFGWGALGALGPLGDDATPTPVKVYDLKNVIAIKAGNGWGFALLKDGTLVGWGSQMVSTGAYKQVRKVITIASFGDLAPKPRND